MRVLWLMALFSFAAVAALVYWTAPSTEITNLSSPFRVGERSTNLLYATATRGFEVVMVVGDDAHYVRGDKRGLPVPHFPAYRFPYGGQIETVCQGDSCTFFAAKRIDKPFGPNTKLLHEYRIGWVERDGILQAVGQENSLYFYPLK